MKHGREKVVSVIGHSFDCLPAHVTVGGRGTASTVRVAAMRAVEDMLCSPALRRKRFYEAKITMVIHHMSKGAPDVQS